MKTIFVDILNYNLPCVCVCELWLNMCVGDMTYHMWVLWLTMCELWLTMCVGDDLTCVGDDLTCVGAMTYHVCGYCDLPCVCELWLTMCVGTVTYHVCGYCDLPCVWVMTYHVCGCDVVAEHYNRECCRGRGRQTERPNTADIGCVPAALHYQPVATITNIYNLQ